MIKGCIFDLDGVIVDTARFHFQAWRELANDLGFEFTEKDNERLKGVSRMRSLEILLKVGGITATEEEKQHLADKKNRRYRELISTLTPGDILPGVMDFLHQARRLGKRLAIASASKNTPLILERIGLDNFFDAVVDGNRITRAKPDPEVFLTAARDLGLEPGQCIVFEDAVAGVEAAHRGGMKAVGVGSRDRLPEADINILTFEGLKCEDIITQLEKE